MNIDRMISIISVIIGLIGIFLSFYWSGQYYNLKNSIVAINSPGANVIGGNVINTQNLIKPPVRHLTEEIKVGLDNKLKLLNPKNIIITSVMGDQEAFQYASEIKQYLESKKWNVEGVTQAVYSQPVIGQFLNQNSDGNVEILIGGQK